VQLQNFGELRGVALNNNDCVLAIDLSSNYWLYVNRGGISLSYSNQLHLTRNPHPTYILAQESKSTIPEGFIGLFLDDNNVAYGMHDGQAAIFDKGTLRLLGPGRVISANNFGTCVGAVWTGTEEVPAIWQHGKMIWQGNRPGVCCSVNSSGVIGVNLFEGFLLNYIRRDELTDPEDLADIDEDFPIDDAYTSAHVWHEGTLSPLLAPSGFQLVSQEETASASMLPILSLGITQVCDSGLILGYQLEPKPLVDDPRERDILQDYTPIVWDQGIARMIHEKAKGMVARFMGPSGEFVGERAFSAEFPMSIGSQTEEGPFWHHQGKTREFDSLRADERSMYDASVYRIKGLNASGHVLADTSKGLCLFRQVKPGENTPRGEFEREVISQLPFWHRLTVKRILKKFR
jgi:hypothetical protein